MLAKLVVWANSRDAAIERMKRALSEFVLLGVRNNIEFLHRVIASAEFLAGKIDTHFLERHSGLLRPPSAELPIEALVAASVGSSKPAASAAGFADVWNSGPWRIV